MLSLGEGKKQWMFDFFQNGRRSVLDGSHPRNEGSAYDANEFADYEDTPYLTGLVNLGSMVGVFVGLWTVIILLGDLHRGIATYWPLLLILGVDLGVNIAARVARARRRPARGPGRRERSRRLQDAPSPTPRTR